MSSQLSKHLFNFTSLVNIVTSKLTLFLKNHIHIFLLFCLGPPKGNKQDALISKERKVKEMYKTVFHKACELGREQELFGITKDEKQLYDTTEQYHRAMDETKLLGDNAKHSPEDFFVSL